MKADKMLTYDGLRAVVKWSPTGVVVFKTDAGGWSVRKDEAVLVGEADKRPRIWRDLDRAVAALASLGVSDARIDLRN